ncbi:hypothetical protein P3X46_029720 [Hevea brasiliensis]|uniref:Phytocyanin domain-containing protein n=1 Tax=Hevea brasiliensis TaxID=3981 RepID=A0ABQ9KV65_HEVBR|nr:early nodulin-like protein 17 [Hevea brasiliensis]KAJ9147574.1 hypothetical protein P3X46_029720 [Hevea brasiliensis]
MEGLARKGIIGLMLVMVVMITVEGASSNLHKVGVRGWIPNYNYTEWLNQQHEHFYVGDWLYFVFDKHYFNVLEVNKTSYESCNDQGFIRNITRGGRDVVELTEARLYYFLSSGGYCWNGMKIAISVEQLPPTPAPAPAKSGSSLTLSSTTASLMILSAAFYVALI